MTYLGKSSMTRDDKMAVEERFSIMEQGYTVGKLLDGTECQILLDTRASKSFISNSHYWHCKSLHSLPKSALRTQRIQVGNGQYLPILFIILIIIDIHGHIFEIYTLVSKIHKNVDMVLRIKNVFELEGVINSWECCFSFLNRSVPICPSQDSSVGRTADCHVTFYLLTEGWKSTPSQVEWVLNPGPGSYFDELITYSHGVVSYIGQVL